MIHLLLSLADSGVTDSTYAGPGAVVIAGLALMAAAAKYYKDARYADVERERNRRIEAETREKESSESTAQKVDDLRKQVNQLERKIDQMRSENDERIDSLRVEHEERLLRERDKNFQLRKLLKDNGVPIPEELGPS